MLDTFTSEAMYLSRELHLILSVSKEIEKMVKNPENLY